MLMQLLLSGIREYITMIQADKLMHPSNREGQKLNSTMGGVLDMLSFGGKVDLSE